MKIDENTKISVGILISLLGGAAWLTSVHLQSVSTADEVKEIKQDVKELREMKSDVEIIRRDVKRVLRKMGEE